MTPQDVVQWAATAGPASIFALLWWLERGERRELQKECAALRDKYQAEKDAMTERVLKGLHDGTMTLAGLKDLFERFAGRANP